MTCTPDTLNPPLSRLLSLETVVSNHASPYGDDNSEVLSGPTAGACDSPPLVGVTSVDGECPKALNAWLQTLGSLLTPHKWSQNWRPFGEVIIGSPTRTLAPPPAPVTAEGRRWRRSFSPTDLSFSQKAVVVSMFSRNISTSSPLADVPPARAPVAWTPCSHLERRNIEESDCP